MRARRHTVLLALAVLGAVPVVLFVLVALLVGTQLVGVYSIPSAAMEPTLQCAAPGFGCTGVSDDRVVTVAYVFSSPRRGDIVAFRAPPKALSVCGTGGVFVKRVIGMPGDIWAERLGYVYIDGRRIDEPYVRADARDASSYPAVRIPAGEYFVMGDNRAGSCDSRSWGLLPRSDIIGKVVATFWPPSRATVR